MTPGVASLVHYYGQDGTCQAAIITRVHADPAGQEPVNLTVFPGSVDRGPVPHDEARSGRSWHWPEAPDPIESGLS